MPSNPRRKLQTWLCLVNCDVRSSLSLLAMDKATIYSFSWVIFHPVSTLSFSILSWVFFFAFVLAGQSACRINQSCADDLMWWLNAVPKAFSWTFLSVYWRPVLLTFCLVIFCNARENVNSLIVREALLLMTQSRQCIIRYRVQLLDVDLLLLLRQYSRFGHKWWQMTRVSAIGIFFRILSQLPSRPGKKLSVTKRSTPTQRRPYQKSRLPRLYLFWNNMDHLGALVHCAVLCVCVGVDFEPADKANVDGRCCFRAKHSCFTFHLRNATNHTQLAMKNKVINIFYIFTVFSTKEDKTD